jgi:hypothetical protein
MKRQRYSMVWAAALSLAVCAAIASTAQAPQEYQNNFKYNVGQSIQPVFEGWSHAPDGTFNLHFGYLNRNYAQELHVPIGPSNSMQPGGPDRGQPTFFYTRTQRNLFTVNVPRDFGRASEIVWTITANGKTEKAIGWLQAEWEIDPVGGAQQGGRTDPEFVANKPPTLALLPVPPVKLPATASLSAQVADDGLPKPRGRGKPAVGQETPPTLQGGVQAPTNVPEVTARTTRETPPGATAAGGAQRPQGLVVSWVVWRGPADATFEPRQAQPKDGLAVTVATFLQPGDYVLRATANDGSKSGHATLPVTVTGSATQ